MVPRICVLGSINMDMVVRVEKFPTSGETMFGLDHNFIPGGKGANQAVAIANLGVSVDLIGALGNDEFGKLLSDYLFDLGVNINGVVKLDEPSGVAIVMVDQKGRNQIVVLSGSNMLFQQNVIEQYLEHHGSDIQYLVSQFEIPLDCIHYAFSKVKSQGGITVLNPSPVQFVPCELIEQTDIFVLNELELMQLASIPRSIFSPDEVAQVALEWVRKIGDKTVVVTLGEKGLVAVKNEQIFQQSAPKVSRVIDTTGAGDCFCGSFVTFLHKGCTFSESLLFAQQAAALSVQVQGASSSFPTLEKLELNTKGDVR